ncbi:MAG: hypothetical protein M1483_00895 [Actinobacteria bacterium]|nr:hypothetical protein [Actinomycetota bacterium]
MSKDRSISKSDAITEKLHLRCFRSISTLVLRSIFILLFLSGSYYLQSTTVSNTVTSNTVTSNTVTSNTATAPYKPSAVAPHAVNSGTTLSTPGYGWNIQYVNSGIGLNSISCPTFLSCFAVGNYDTSNNAPVILQSSNSGSTWSSDTIPTANAPSVLSAVWCANGFNCWAVGYSTDNNGTTTVALFTTNGGASWSPQTIPSAVFSSWPISLKTIDCPTPDYCFAAGTENNGQGTPLILSTTNGGASWSPETVPISSFSPQSVSCPTSTTCWLSGTNGSPNNQQGVVLTTSNSGATWTVQTIPSAVGDIATVYCPTTGVCLAGGYLLNSTSIGGAVMLTTNDSGALWTETPLPSSVDAVYSISCPNSVDCWAMASSGVAGSLPISLATTDSGKSWSEIPLAQGVTSVSLYSSTSLSCPSTAFCWTVGTGNPSTSNSVQDSSSGVILSSNMSLELAQPALGPYTPLGSPTRICDTRPSNPSALTGAAVDCTGKTLSAGSVLNVQVSGVSGIPTGSIGAVVANITVTNTTQSSYLTVWPEGTAQPTASNLNWASGSTVSNLVVVPLSSSGSISIYNYSGSVDVIVDVEGWYTSSSSTSPSGTVFTSTSPTRICDTRPSNPSALTGAAAACTGKTLSAGSVLNVQVSGVSGIPTGSIGAVVVNITVTNTTQSSYLTVWPEGTAQPTASNLNWASGSTVSNLVVVPLSSSGAISIYNKSGSADVIVDVEGWYTTYLSNAYHRLAVPTRICDTRAGSGEPCAGDTLGKGPNPETLSVQVSGVSGIPTGSISAVVANITVTDTTQSSYLTAWPEGTAQPTASNLNWVSGKTKSVLVEIGLSSSGAISIYNYAGSVDVIVDVEGWVGPGSSPSGMYNPLGSPTRICDTRPSNPSALTGAAAACTGKTLSAGSVLNVQVSGVSGIPTGSIGAVVANITVTNTTQSSYLTVWPEGTAQPTASNLNWASGSTVSNLVVVPLSSSGSISIYNYSGSVDVIVDVEGWYTSSSSTSPSGTVFTSTSPTRICDTRPSNPSALTGAAAACTGKTLSTGSVLNVQVSGVSGIPTGSIGAVVANITVTDTTQSSYLTVWPEGTAQPTASNLNWASGSTVSNLVVVPLSSSGAISIYNKSGSADVIVDVEGWYG